MRKSEIYSSGWLKAPDLIAGGQPNGINLTIKGVHTGETDDGKEQRILSFTEDGRQLGLNVTNWDTIAEITGKDDDDHWIGTRINVYPHKLDRPYNGKTHGIRIRKPSNASALPSGNTDAARKAAFESLKVSLPPDTTREELGKKWLDAIAAQFPGRQQVMLTSDEWTQLKEFFMGYQGEPGEAAAADDGGIPF